VAGAGDGSRAILVVGFESSDHDVGPWLARALDICAGRSMARAAPARGSSRGIKLAASEAILAHGGTITHHHAVDRDHRRWYPREVPTLFTNALHAAKAEFDPSGIMTRVCWCGRSGPRTATTKGKR
jgi:hypothetical protein